jgi:phage tail sheath protein FI
MADAIGGERSTMAVKIKKRPSSTRPIEAVGTSTAAFVGTARRGPVDRPVQVRGLADFQKTFGSLLPDSGMGYAVQHFFDNGGTEALIVRVAGDALISAPALEAQKRGLWALEKAELFGLLCIPPLTQGIDIGRQARDAATAYCARRRALFIADPSSTWQSAAQAKAGLQAGFLTRSAYAAVFLPFIKAPDQAANGQIRSFAPCGAVAGVLARTDASSGVWKAAAGRAATLKGASAPTVALNAAQSAELNELGGNCLRSLPGSGTVVWGSRTFAGISQPSPEWKYIPVRRLASLIEESIARGTRWVTFEPNDEQTWGKLRLRVGDFLHDLFKRGAFAGRKAEESYFVKCDRSIMTQGDIDAGLVNIEVGFAPLKPAEFVVIRIQQMAGKPTE